MTDFAILTPNEIEAMTGFKIATRQLAVLRERGFHRAFVNRAGAVVLERAHYDAVCRGQMGQQPQAPKAANLSFLKGRVAA